MTTKKSVKIAYAAAGALMLGFGFSAVPVEIASTDTGISVQITQAEARRGPKRWVHGTASNPVITDFNPVPFKNSTFARNKKRIDKFNAKKAKKAARGR